MPSRAPGFSSHQHANHQILTNMAINVKVNIHRNTWIRHRNTEVELDGSLNINKHPGDPLTVVGEIDIRAIRTVSSEYLEQSYVAVRGGDAPRLSLSLVAFAPKTVRPRVSALKFGLSRCSGLTRRVS